MIDRGGSNRRGNVCLPFWGTFNLDLSLATASSSHKICFPVRITSKVCFPISGTGNKLFLPLRDLSLATTSTAGNKVQCILLMEELFLSKVPANTSQRTNGRSNVGQLSILVSLPLWRPLYLHLPGSQGHTGQRNNLGEHTVHHLFPLTTPM